MINLFIHIGLSNPYQFDKSFFNLSVVGSIFISILILMKPSFSDQ